MIISIIDFALQAWTFFFLFVAAVGGIHSYAASRPLYINLSDGMKGFFALLLLRMVLLRSWDPREVPVIKKTVSFFQKLCTFSNAQLFLLVLGYGAILFGAAALNHWMLGTGNDFGLYLNFLHNASHGWGFNTYLQPAGHLLQVHLYLVMYWLKPLYSIFGSPYFLLLSQSLAIILGAVPVYWLARSALPERWQHILCAVLYLLSPRLRDINLYDFHPITFSIPFLLFAIYFFQRDRLLPFLIFLGLGCINREMVFLISGFFGFFLVFQRQHSRQRWRDVGLLLLFIGPLVFWLYRGVYMKLIPQGDFQVHYYSWLGKSLGEVLSNAGAHPVKLLKVFFSVSRFKYIEGILLPLGFVPLLAPSYLFMTIPTWGYILAREPLMFNIHEHHPAELAPFLWAAFVLGYRRLLSLTGPEGKGFFESKAPLATLLVVGSTLTWYGRPETSVIHSYLYRRPEFIPFHEFMRTVPPDWSVAANWDYYIPQIARRHYAFKLEDVLETPGVINLALINTKLPQSADQARFLTGKGFRLIFWDGPHRAYASVRAHAPDDLIRSLHWHFITRNRRS